MLWGESYNVKKTIKSTQKLNELVIDNVQDAFDDLSPKYQRVVLSQYVFKLNINDASAKEGISAATFYRRLNAAHDLIDRFIS